MKKYKNYTLSLNLGKELLICENIKILKNLSTQSQETDLKENLSDIFAEVKKNNN